MRPYLADLDILPLPDRDLICAKDPISSHSETEHLISGRGCPYDCTYRFNH